jgi:methionyl-tRNA formyltransferase
MKLILMGTPGFIVPIFDKISSEHEIVAVFTRAPKPVGRKKIITKTPVHTWAESKNIRVFNSIKNLTDTNSNIQKPDYILVAAYGVILKDEVLNFAPCINIHPSLLPKYRGPSPITTAILNGDKTSGVCLMDVVSEVDAGDVFMCREFDIGENETESDIENKVSKISADMVLEFLKNPEQYPPIPQVGTPSFTRKVESNDLIIDWSKTPSEIHNQVCAIGGKTTVNGIDVKVLKTSVVDGVLKFEQVQPAGKNPMSWADFMNGQHGKCDIK